MILKQLYNSNGKKTWTLTDLKSQTKKKKSTWDESVQI